MEEEIGGTPFKGCVSVNAQTGAVERTFNEKICYTDIAANCTDASGTAKTPDTAVSWDGGDCETVTAPLLLCTTNADCPGTSALCANAQTGACGTGTGKCS